MNRSILIAPVHGQQNETRKHTLVFYKRGGGDNKRLGFAGAGGGKRLSFAGAWGGQKAKFCRSLGGAKGRRGGFCRSLGEGRLGFAGAGGGAKGEVLQERVWGGAQGDTHRQELGHTQG